MPTAGRETYWHITESVDSQREALLLSAVNSAANTPPLAISPEEAERLPDEP